MPGTDIDISVTDTAMPDTATATSDTATAMHGIATAMPDTDTMPEASQRGAKHTLSLATGLLAAPFIEMLTREFMERFPDTRVTVYPVRNDFFGERITVSGLLTGQDIVAQLKGKDLGERLLLPCNMFKSGENIFLDDMTLEELISALQVEVCIVKSSGQDLLWALLG
jgi:NifB/MoaA-like Fe-S oxidoreductase